MKKRMKREPKEEEQTSSEDSVPPEQSRNAPPPPHVEVDSRFCDGYVIEDDEFVSLRIKEMKEAIDRMNTDTGLAYRLALIKAPEQCGDAFHLMCLRSEYFHPIFSAKKAVRYWQMRIELFGIDRGYSSLDDINESASPEEDRWKPLIFFTEKKDDRGRPIFRTKFLGEFFPSTIDGWDKETDNILRVLWRGFEQLISDDFAQKFGAVCINEIHQLALEAKFVKKIAYVARFCFPIKWMQIHMIMEPSFKSFLLMAYQNVIGQRFRSRQIFHSTNKMLTLGVLESRFGIPRSILEDWETPTRPAPVVEIDPNQEATVVVEEPNIGPIQNVPQNQDNP